MSSTPLTHLGQANRSLWNPWGSTHTAPSPVGEPAWGVAACGLWGLFCSLALSWLDSWEVNQSFGKGSLH